MPGDTARDAFERAAMEAAHEALGPLTTVGAALDLLASAIDPEDDEAQQALVLAQRHLRTTELQLARLGRLRFGPQEPARRPTDLAALARELVEDLSLSVLAEHDTSVEVHGPVEAEVDPEQVRGLLFNLLSNAAKYSPPGRAVVVAIEDGGDEILLRVRDQGDGVAPDDVPRIFERYGRGDHVEVRGVGLGLPLARDIARAHGGDLVLEPARNEGSTFLLRLPRREGGGR